MSRRRLRTFGLGCLILGALGGSDGSLPAQQEIVPPIVSGDCADVCCEACRQNPCRCRLRRPLVNPNRFRVAPCPAPGEWAPAPAVVSEGEAISPAPGGEPSENEPSLEPSPEMAPSAEPSPDTFALSSGLGSGFQSSAADVATIGDFFAGSAIITGPTWGQVPIVLPTAGGDRRYKLTEHTSPLPTDRMFFDYHVFNNAVVDANGNVIDLNRYLFGFERTFGAGNMSVEVRLPLANGADSQQVQDIGGPVLRANEFGNLSLTPKFLLYRDCRWAVSTGLGVIFPTAEESELSTGGTTVVIENTAYHLLPYLAFQRNLSRNSWATLYTQADFACASNSVTSYDQTGLAAVDEYTDQNLLFIDLSFGHWFYRNQGGRGCLRGIAGIVELHYTSTMTDTDVAIAGSPFNFDPFPPSGGTQRDVISNPYNRLDVLNTTAGLRFQVGDNSLLTVAGVAPLRDDEESLFDGEFVVQLSRRH